MGGGICRPPSLYTVPSSALIPKAVKGLSGRRDKSKKLLKLITGVFPAVKPAVSRHGHIILHSGKEN